MITDLRMNTDEEQIVEAEALISFFLERGTEMAGETRRGLMALLNKGNYVNSPYNNIILIQLAINALIDALGPTGAIHLFQYMIGNLSRAKEQKH